MCMYACTHISRYVGMHVGMKNMFYTYDVLVPSAGADGVLSGM